MKKSISQKAGMWGKKEKKIQLCNQSQIERIKSLVKRPYRLNETQSSVICRIYYGVVVIKTVSAVV